MVTSWNYPLLPEVSETSGPKDLDRALNAGLMGVIFGVHTP